ncbi:jg358, partial [Pararge aegeria aegeria]
RELDDRQGGLGPGANRVGSWPDVLSSAHGTAKIRGNVRAVCRSAQDYREAPRSLSLCEAVLRAPAARPIGW